MYKVEAVIQLERLDDVKNALVAQGLEEFVVTELRGHDSLDEQTGCYRGVTYEIPFKRHICVELSVPEPALDVMIECIRKAVHSGTPSVGKIFVTQLTDVIEISLDRPPAHDPPTQNQCSVRLSAQVSANPVVNSRLGRQRLQTHVSNQSAVNSSKS